MKIRFYEDGQKEYFPLYTATTDLNHNQERIKRPVGYEYHQVFLVSEGTGVLHIDGQTFMLQERDLFYIAADVPHEYYAGEGKLLLHYLSFFGKGFPDIRGYYGLGDWGFFANKSRGSFEASLRKLFETMDTTREVSTLCGLTFSAVISFFDEACKKEYSPLQTVYNYIENNYAGALILDDLCVLYPYSKTKLCKDFKAHYGVTIFDTITDIRLRHARYLLLDSPFMKLEKVANACGFNDVSYFCKMYRRKYGYSPRQHSRPSYPSAGSECPAQSLQAPK